MSAEVGTDGLVFEAERALNTGDSQDRVFTDDSVEGDTLFVTNTSRIVLRGREYLRVSAVISDAMLPPAAGLARCRRPKGYIFSRFVVIAR